MQLNLNKFFIFSDNRTGSSCLLSLISHAYRMEFKINGLMGGISEPFHPRVIEYFYGEKLYRKLYPREPEYEQDPYKWKNEGRVLKEDLPFIRGIFDNALKESYGVKHIWSHLLEEHNKYLISLASARKYKIIFLNRDQVVKKTLSYLLSEMTNAWRAYQSPPQFSEVDIDRLDLLINKYNNQKRIYETALSNVEHYNLKYEDFLGYDDFDKKISEFKKILNFCGVSSCSFNINFCKGVMSPYRKMNTKKILKSIPNFKEVQEFAKDKYNENIT